MPTTISNITTSSIVQLFLQVNNVAQKTYLFLGWASKFSCFLCCYCQWHISLFDLCISTQLVLFRRQLIKYFIFLKKCQEIYNEPEQIWLEDKCKSEPSLLTAWQMLTKVSENATIHSTLCRSWISQRWCSSVHTLKQTNIFI